MPTEPRIIKIIDPHATALHLAAFKPSLADLGAMIQQTPALVDARDSHGRTPLHCAIVAENNAMVQLLINEGASLEMRDNTGKTPLQLASLHQSTAIEMLLRAGAKDANNTPLHDAIMGGKHERLSALLRKDKTQLDTVNARGLTPVMVAASKNDFEAVKILVEANADLDVQDLKGTLAIDLTDDPNIKKYLIDKNSPESGCVRELIHYFVAMGNVPKVKGLLSLVPEMVDYLDAYGRTPLMIAAQYQQRKMIELLLQAKADIDRVHPIIQDSILSLVEPHSELYDYLLQKIALPESELEFFRNFFKSLFTKELAVAKSKNKKLLVTMAEIHGAFKLEQVKKIIFEVASECGIDTYFIDKAPSEILPLELEINPLNKWVQTTLGMKIIGVDQLNRLVDMSIRNITLSRELSKNPQHGVLKVGAGHLQGLLTIPDERLNPNDFHIVPINLTALIKNHYRMEEVAFARNPRYAIQVNRKKVSDPCQPILHANKPLIREVVSQPALIFSKHKTRKMDRLTTSGRAKKVKF